MITMHRLFVVGLAVALALTGMVVAPPPAHAQDGDTTLYYNDPAIVTLSQGQSVDRTFSVLAGDTFEVRLSPLAPLTFTAVLIDPAQTPMPLAPGADGIFSAVINNAPGSGVYTLVLQATTGSGDLLIQIISDAVEPEPLNTGDTLVDLGTSARRFMLTPPAGVPSMQLALEPVALPGTDVTGLPEITLTQADSGEVALALAPGLLPAVTVMLPPDQPFMLALAPGEQPLQVMITWSDTGSTSQVVPTPTTIPTTAPNTGSTGPQPSTSGPCQLTFTGAVNLRPGPGVEWDPPVAQAAAGTTLPVTGHNGNYTWYQVNYNGQLMWASGQIPATQTLGNCTNLPQASYPPPPNQPAQPVQGTTPTVTYTPSGPTPTYTATVQGQVPHTPTYTPSYTPTTPPAPQTAPPDSNYAITIPLDNTVSFTEFVSYPDGDTEDRMGWNITGMNPNVAFSGGKARLVITATCFGEGTQYVQFFTGGQTYGCGQTVVDREVTYESRTGTVTITAVGGEGTYVQWVLTATATRTD